MSTGRGIAEAARCYHVRYINCVSQALLIFYVKFWHQFGYERPDVLEAASLCFPYEMFHRELSP